MSLEALIEEFTNKLTLELSHRHIGEYMLKAYQIGREAGLRESKNIELKPAWQWNCSCGCKNFISKWEKDLTCYVCGAVFNAKEKNG